MQTRMALVVCFRPSSSGSPLLAHGAKSHFLWCSFSMSTPCHVSDGCRDREVSSEPSAWCEACWGLVPFRPFAGGEAAGPCDAAEAPEPGQGQDAAVPAPGCWGQPLPCSQPGHVLHRGANPATALGANGLLTPPLFACVDILCSQTVVYLACAEVSAIPK